MCPCGRVRRSRSRWRARCRPTIFAWLRSASSSVRRRTCDPTYGSSPGSASCRPWLVEPPDTREGRPVMSAAHVIDVHEVIERCRCGDPVARGAERFGLECGGACCTACAITLESVAYCRYCAATLLGTTASPLGGQFELS